MRCRTAPGSRRCSRPSGRSRTPRRWSGSSRRTSPGRSRRRAGSSPSTSRRSSRRGVRSRTRPSRSSAPCASASAERRRASSITARRARTSSTARRCSSPGAPSRSSGATSAGPAAECARIAETYRSFPAAARTLLQPAVPTTVGYRAALWLSGLLDAGSDSAALRLPAQLGGAAGTLAALGPQALEVVGRFAAELELAEPLVPWHTNRAPIAELGAALAASASACSKIGSRRRPARAGGSGGGVRR